MNGAVGKRRRLRVRLKASNAGDAADMLRAVADAMEARTLTKDDATRLGALASDGSGADEAKRAGLEARSNDAAARALRSRRVEQKDTTSVRGSAGKGASAAKRYAQRVAAARQKRRKWLDRGFKVFLVAVPELFKRLLGTA